MFYISKSICFSGVFLVSGIYDLQPILSTYVNEPLKMTESVCRVWLEIFDMIVLDYVCTVVQNGLF